MTVSISLVDIVYIVVTIILAIKMSELIQIIKDERKENKEKESEAKVERVTRRDINGDYGFRNPLYSTNSKGLYRAIKPNAGEVQESNVGDEDDEI